MMWTNISFMIFCMLSHVIADIYMHNPRGSNNRWNEAGRARNNANRMFDSQNNNRGGYNIGSLYYTQGSKLQVQWTNQHSCGGENTDCDVIIQYACGDQIRDGTTTSTIPRNAAQCENMNCNEDRRYGMHEDFYSYKHCKLRERNKGLFTSNQNVPEGASRTRQNNKGNQYGYECTEERDYYPYWGPTIWKDVAVLTNNISRCEYYAAESQNVKDRFYCKVDRDFLMKNIDKPPGNKYIPITKEVCEEFTYKVANVETKGVWTKVEKHGIKSPECLQSQRSRDNHLGNSDGGKTANYNWTIPNDINDHCTLRIRYNITSGEYDRDNTTSAQNNRLNRESNGPDVWSRFGFNEEEGVARGYELVNDPKLDVFGEGKFKLQVALDTSQFGRTFQDRSHTFAIRGRPADVPADATIRNLNVRGKRGNIVQVFPAVEYDFTPNTLVSGTDDYVHVQWTGSDNNPKNNDGQGRAGTDRSNLVLLEKPKYDEKQLEIGTIYGQLGRSYPQSLKGENLAGLSQEALLRLSVFYPDHIGGDMDELDDAGTYFDLGPRKVTSAGRFHFMCTRNNNFSNRSQKGKLVVIEGNVQGSQVDKRGGTIAAPARSKSHTAVEVPPESLKEPKYVELREEPYNLEYSMLKDDAPPHNDYVSQLVIIEPQEIFSEEKPIEVKMDLEQSVRGVYDVFVYRTMHNSSSWYQLDIDDIKDGQVIFHSSSGGTFIAVKSLNIGYVAAITIASISGMLLLILIFVCWRKSHMHAYFQNKI